MPNLPPSRRSAAVLTASHRNRNRNRTSFPLGLRVVSWASAADGAEWSCAAKFAPGAAKLLRVWRVGVTPVSPMEGLLLDDERGHAAPSACSVRSRRHESADECISEETHLRSSDHSAYYQGGRRP